MTKRELKKLLLSGDALLLIKRLAKAGGEETMPTTRVVRELVDNALVRTSGRKKEERKAILTSDGQRLYRLLVERGLVRG